MTDDYGDALLHEDIPGIDYDLVAVDQTIPRYGLHLGARLLRVHPETRCAGTPCSIHNPSDHHMTAWRQVWRGDRGIMERLCPHGIGHPDCDDLAVRAGDAVHSCDGCCRTPKEDR